jgi:hypothetical protein
MNSSPPLPSFTLPPLNSAGQFPITPSPTPSPNKEEGGHDFSTKSKGKKAEVYDEEDGGRISMYVRLFEGKYPNSNSVPDGGIVLSRRND